MSQPTPPMTVTWEMPDTTPDLVAEITARDAEIARLRAALEEIRENARNAAAHYLAEIEHLRELVQMQDAAIRSAQRTITEIAQSITPDAK